MTGLLQWPPLHVCVYSLHGHTLRQEPDEPFVTFMADGSVDTDLKRQTPGFINRIQRFGIQNKLSPELWSEDTIYASLLERLPLSLRGKFFRPDQSGSPRTPVLRHTIMNAVPHPQAPVPPGLAAAAGYPDVADDDPDLPLRLAAQTPERWHVTLRKWLEADPARRATRTQAGPAWWYALHVVARNPHGNASPLRFVGVWLGRFPCRRCRIRARAYIGRVPPPRTWAEFPGWADRFHNHVTATKK